LEAQSELYPASLKLK